jgi:hypothetical protein
MSLLILFALFILIFLIFLFINIIIKKKNIEKYGIYCGRYNINQTTAETKCKADNECAWNNYTAQDKTQHGWCGQNPSTAAK